MEWQNLQVKMLRRTYFCIQYFDKLKRMNGFNKNKKQKRNKDNFYSI